MRGSCAVLVALLGLALVGCAGAPESAAPPSRVERPLYELGEKWIRNDGVYELIRLESDRYVFSGPAGREIRLTRDLVVSTVTRGSSGLQFIVPCLG